MTKRKETTRCDVHGHNWGPYRAERSAPLEFPITAEIERQPAPERYLTKYTICRDCGERLEYHNDEN